MGAKRLSCLVLCLSLVVALSAAARATDYVTERVNLNRFGTQSNGGSWAPSMSDDGRFVAWHSWATDLVSGDTNGRYDVYVRDLVLQTNHLISITSSGGANGESLYPGISADGLTVAFQSVASNLVPSDTNGFQDVFVRDWTVGPIELVSVATSGAQGDGASNHAMVSGDGRFVVFRSEATNLIPGGNPYAAIYVRDRLNATTECASVSSTGALAAQVSGSPTITPDGRFVVFSSWAGNLAPGDTNGTLDVFVRDRQNGTTERVSVATGGAQGNDRSAGSRPAITPDGRFVAFSSLASNLVAGDTNGVWDVFVRDRQAGTTELVSLSTTGQLGNGNSGADSYVLAISDDGRYVEFCSQASNLVAGDTNGLWDTYVRDRQTGTTERISISTAGVQPNLPAGYYGLDMSSDGVLRVFDSHAHNLVLNDTSTCINTFLRRPADWTWVAPAADFSASPTSGLAPLAVQFTDASSGAPTSWAWTFGDGATSIQQSPSHTYAAAGSYSVSLTVTNAAGSDTETKTAYISVAPGHAVTVSAAASPSSVASGGTTTLSAFASDSLGHGIASWSWSDGGAGGTFSSATAQSPTYTAAANTTGANTVVTLTVLATCSGSPSASGTAATTLTVLPAATGHTVTVTASAAPTTVPSGGTTTLTATAADTRHSAGSLAWSWSDNGAGGVFSSTTVRNPTYTAPANTTAGDRTITLTATAICKWQAPWVSGSTNVTLTVQPQATAHTLTASASALPTTVASGGTTSLSASATDELGHGIASWSWSDGGAGGAFSSASAQNPTYSAPANTTGSDTTITLTVTTTCGGSSSATASTSTALTVQSVPHTLTASASASPTTVTSAGTASLSANATDGLGHAVTWSWSDGGAGGTFSSVTAQNPTYTAPANLSGSDRAITLTATATCRGSVPASTAATAVLTVQPVAHEVTASASASPNTVASGGTTTLAATATDALGHALTWSWSDGGAGGAFSSATAQDPTYTAAANTSGSVRNVTLTVTATCSDSSAVSGQAEVSLAVESVAHSLAVSASASPTAVASGGTTSLSASATDELGHGVASWSWSDGGAGGVFSDPSAQSPTYTAAANTSGSVRNVTLTVTATCSGSSAVSGQAQVSLAVESVAHSLAVSATASPATISSGGKVKLAATATDSLGHTTFGWTWSDSGAGGKFTPSANVRTPTYTAARNTSGSAKTITLTVTAACTTAAPTVTATAQVSVTEQSGSR